jgi:hypothetical protein
MCRAAVAVEHEDYTTGSLNFAELYGVAGRPSDDEPPCGGPESVSPARQRWGEYGRTVARFGRIDRRIGEPPCARRCRRTEARNAARGS